jgi:hypothetical protein
MRATPGRPMITLLLLLVAASCAPSKVDADLVGTWELNVPNADGIARWVWDIHANGSYDFHADGPGGVPSHSGTFEARSGTYALRSTTIAWVDSGSYQLQGNTLNATGRLGTGAWTRVQTVAVQPSHDSSVAPAVAASLDSMATMIYAYLSHHTFDDGLLAVPLKATRTATVNPDRQELSDGVLGIVRTDVRGSSSPATISFVVFRNRALAEAARDVYGTFDAKTFRSKPGEMVSSHAYTYHEWGNARCLSRLMIGSSFRATVTCYLLVQLPAHDPVMIESELSEQVATGGQEASLAAVERADALMFAGIKEWGQVRPAIGRP